MSAIEQPAERSGKIEKARESILDEVPITFPALIEGNKLAKKAAKVGFDWEHTDQVFEKLDEELIELKDAINSENSSNIEEEIGDLLFELTF